MDIYQLWFEWLKRADASYEAVSFEDWYRANEEEFIDWKKNQVPFQVIESKEDFEYWHAPDAGLKEMCVFINLEMTKQELTAAFQQLLKDHHDGKAGRPKFASWADAALDRKTDAPTLRVLEVMLKVHDLRRDTELKLWEIGEQLKLNPSQITKPTDTQGELTAKKAVMNSTVSRYLKWGENVKNNVVLGVFPKYK